MTILPWVATFRTIFLFCTGSSEGVLVIVSEQFQLAIAWVIQLECLESWDFHSSTTLQPTDFHGYCNKCSAYSSFGMVVNNCTMLYDRELLQWEIAWFFRMGTFQLELLLCIFRQEITAKGCLHMTWNSSGLASAILGTQCYIFTYCGVLGNHCSCCLLPKVSIGTPSPRACSVAKSRDTTTASANDP